MASGLAVNREDTRNRFGHADEILVAVEFRVDVARERGAVRISPVGEIDLATIGCLRERTSEAMAAGPGRLILDLRETSFLDSSALHLAVEILEWAERTGTQFAVIPGPPVVQRTFEVAGLGERLPFVDVPRA